MDLGTADRCTVHDINDGAAIAQSRIVAGHVTQCTCGLAGECLGAASPWPDFTFVLARFGRRA
jgi:hypothetical protein